MAGGDQAEVAVGVSKELAIHSADRCLCFTVIGRPIVQNQVGWNHASFSQS